MLIIYIENLLLVNLLIHLFTTLIIKEIFYLKMSKLFILTIFIDMLYMIFYVYNFDFIFLKYLLPIIFSFLSFKTNFYTYLKIFTIYYLLSLTLGGLSLTLNISSNMDYFLIFILFIAIIFTLFLFFKRKDIDITYRIEYTFRYKKYKLNAFYDTGSNLIYKGLPVVILNEKYSFNIFTSDEMSFNNGMGIYNVPCYYIDKFKIDKTVIKCYCIFLQIDYECIIGSNVFSL